VLEKDGDDQLDRTYEIGRSIKQSKWRQEHRTYNKKEKCWLDWSHLAWELPSKTCYWRKYKGKDRSDGKTRKKT